jgi:hypothetical protein
MKGYCPILNFSLFYSDAFFPQQNFLIVTLVVTPHFAIGAGCMGNPFVIQEVSKN